MTNILAMCSALNNTYLALKYDNQIFSKIIQSDENYHSLYLIKEIQKMFLNNNFKYENLSFITTNQGPGSFTGIRVSLTIAKVMAQELNLPLVGLNTNEILLNAYDCNYLIMDARRDMYYIASKDKIELKYKNELPVLKGRILVDKRSESIIKDSICYEDGKVNLGEVMIKLAEEKYNNIKSKDYFSYLNANANYIQTPPIFSA